MAPTAKVHAVKQCDAVTLLKSSSGGDDAADAAVTITTTATQFAVIWKVTYSYDAAPLDGNTVTITPLLNNEDYTDYVVATTYTGPQEITGPFYGDVGDDIVVTVEGATGDKGAVNVSYTLHNVYGG